MTGITIVKVGSEWFTAAGNPVTFSMGNGEDFHFQASTLKAKEAEGKFCFKIGDRKYAMGVIGDKITSLVQTNFYIGDDHQPDYPVSELFIPRYKQFSGFFQQRITRPKKEGDLNIHHSIVRFPSPESVALHNQSVQ